VRVSRVKDAVTIPHYQLFPIVRIKRTRASRKSLTTPMQLNSTAITAGRSVCLEEQRLELVGKVCGFAGLLQESHGAQAF
jgi:hypothetical protein